MQRNQGPHKLCLTFPHSLSLCQMNMDPQSDRLPPYFNSAEKWPGKIHEPLDQGNCAASWAFSTAGKRSQRIRKRHENILKYGMRNITMSKHKKVTFYTIHTILLWKFFESQLHLKRIY